MAKLDPKNTKPLLKEPLQCWRCGSEMKNMPTLKAHLQEEWDKQATQEKAKLERKRKFEARQHKNDGDEHQDKKPKQKAMMSILMGLLKHDIVQRNTYEFLTSYGTCLQIAIVSSFVHLAAAAACSAGLQFFSSGLLTGTTNSPGQFISPDCI